MHSVLQLGSRAAPSHTRDGACGGRRGHPENRGVPAHWAWAWPLVLLQQGFAGLRQQQASPASEMWRGIQGEFGWGHSGGDTPRRIRKWPNPWPEPSMHTTPRLWQGLAALQAPSPAPQPPGPTPCERLHLHEATWTPSQRCPGPGSPGVGIPNCVSLGPGPGVRVQWLWPLAPSRQVLPGHRESGRQGLTMVASEPQAALGQPSLLCVPVSRCSPQARPPAIPL